MITEAPARARTIPTARALTGRARDRVLILGLTVFSFALAFWQAPGTTTADTKIDLHVDPGSFLSFVAAAWSNTADLGEVHSAQYSGYLWPMGPFFAALHAIGIGPWVVERIWLGVLFTLAAWGMVRLMDLIVGRPRGIAHLAAAAFFVLNPYVVVFTARTSITLIGYAALPWLLIVTYHGVRATRGLRGWRSWWWASAFALILTSTGGGVNAAVVGWMLVGPVVLALYEPAVGTVRWRDGLGFLVRAGALSLIASLWWVVPVLVHVHYGINFLQYTEQPATIWGTNSLTESLRLMGYWTSYLGVGYGINRPFSTDASTLLFNPFVVTASLLLPALAVAGFVRARRISYAPLLLLLVVVGVTIETAGFPDGTPVRGTMVWIYEHIFVLSFMRTTNKAAPLVAVGVAGLVGLGARELIIRARRARRVHLRRTGPVAIAIALTGLIVLAALPLIRGDAIDTQLSFQRIPSAWSQAAQGLNRTLPVNTRAMVLPGQIFAYYRWGGTLDAILPRLTTRPVAVRYETPYSDLHADDLLATVDDLVQENRLLPGELTPLLRLIGVGAVITGADDDISRSGALAPAAAAGVLARQGFGAPAHSYGPVAGYAAAAGDLGGTTRLPEIRRYQVPGSRGIVHVDPVGPATVVDGSAQSLGDLAAFGALPSTAPVLYAGDQSPAQLRSLAAQGANLVIGDSNRRQVYVPQSTQQNRGPVLAADASFPTGAATLNPFAAAGAAAQTVSALQGARYVTSPSQFGELQFPEDGPFAAFDGKLSTEWIADRNAPVTDRWVQVGFNAPRNVAYVDVTPFNDAHGTVTQVDVNGISHAVGAGRTRIPVHLHGVSAVRVTVTGLIKPRQGDAGAGGFREIAIPGLHLRQYLRAPIVIGRDLAGTDLSHDSLSYLFARQTGDDPFRRSPYGATTLLDDPRARGDAESQLQRIVFAPAARSYRVAAWVSPAVTALDSALDGLTGYRGQVRYDSSSRYQDRPAYRASSAFAPGTSAPRPGWISVWEPGQAPSPWISFSTPRALSVSSLRITPSSAAVRRPTMVQLSWGTGHTGALPVAADGTINLGQTVRTRALKLTVLAAVFAPGTTAAQGQAHAVGIGAVTVPGLAAARVPERGRLVAPCGTVAIAIDGRRVPMAPIGTVSELDAGRPLPARACAVGRAGATPSVPMRAGVARVRSLRGPLSVDTLRLRSPAPHPVPVPASGGTVLSSGDLSPSDVSGVRVALRGRSWVVLGESWDHGWRATCDGRSLGAPQVIDGYANGWLAPAGCRRVAFSFGPQSGINESYLVSAVAAALMLLLLAFGAARQPAVRTAAQPSSIDTVEIDAVGRGRPLPVAIALGALAALPLGYLFALRAGAALFVLLTLVLWRGVRTRTLILIAAGLLGIVVPAIYLLATPADKGGYNFAYSLQLISAHWVGVTAIVLISLALARAISARAQASRNATNTPRAR
ncbi:MAG: alpha-(1-_3)-arabinofuranosyltransferase family protein [Solirubrobacteraceae bacterium]